MISLLRFISFASIFLTFTFSVRLLAQSPAASSSAPPCAAGSAQPARVLSGRVLDPVGGGVPGATVTAICGGARYTAVANEVGSYELTLAPGRYRVEVEGNGFDAARREIVVGDSGASVIVTLQIAGIGEILTVGAEADAPAIRSTSATKTNTPLAEIPQAVTVVTRGRIEDTGAQGLQEALNYAAGVRSDAYGLDSRTDSVLVRGSYPDEYLDGLRQHFNYYTSTTRVDPYLLERIEVLRGPSSMLYGQGTTAGVVNLVSKRPLEQEQREVSLQLGSYDRKQAQADVTGPLTADGRWLYRLVALGRSSETQVDHVADDRSLLAPSLTWRPSGDTTLTMQALWQRDRSGSTLQFLPWSGNLVSNPNGDIPTNRFVGEPELDRYDSDRISAGWLLEHRLGERWTLRQNVRAAHNEVDYRSLYADSFTVPGDSFLDPEQRVIGRHGWQSANEVDIVTADQHAEGRFTTGLVRHSLLAGVDFVRFREASKSAYDAPQHLGGNVPPVDVYAPVYGGYTPPPLSDDPGSSHDQLGLYVQDQMKLGSRWIVVTGLRHDRTNSGLEGSDTDKSRATTGRLGVMYVLAGGWSPYASYSESFTPLAGTDFYGDRFDPMKGRQYELGVKVQPAGGTYSFTAALFDLRELNRLVSDPGNPLNSLQAGETKTTGLELEWVGKMGRALDLVAHYNYLDNDDQLEGVPAHQAALWATRAFSIARMEGLSAGLGVRYFSAFADATAPETPQVTLLDGLLEWEHDRWRYALNVTNLMDKRYVSTCLYRGDCFPGSRRNLALTATHRF